MNAEVVPIDVRKAVPLRGDLPLALQPSVRRARLRNLVFKPFRSLVVATHLLGADAADIEVLVQIHVLHVVDVADLVSAANSMPSRKGAWGDSYCRRRHASRPTGATRMTPPQPLLSLWAGSPRELIVCRAGRQVLPGARRLCSWRCCNNQPGSSLPKSMSHSGVRLGFAVSASGLSSRSPLLVQRPSDAFPIPLESNASLGDGYKHHFALMDIF